jgi:hypothetical protein
MQASKYFTERIGLKAGLLICLTLILYFIFMRYTNLTGRAIAWGFNLIILFVGIVLTLSYFRTHTKPTIDYLPGMLLGSVTTSVCTFTFTFFVYIYFSAIDSDLLLSLKDNILFMGKEVTPLRAAGATLIEGLSSGIIISFIMMQYYKSGFGNASEDVTISG